MENFKQISHKVSYCGIICALSVMVMAVSIIPGFTYALPAVSGIFIWSISVFINYKWALLSYMASCLLSVLLIPEIEAKTVYIAFFGYYPIIRELLGKIKYKILRFFIGFIIFNIACITSYKVLLLFIPIDRILQGMEGFGDMALLVFWAAANFSFLCYELCLSQLVYVMYKWIKPKFIKRIK